MLTNRFFELKCKNDRDAHIAINRGSLSMSEIWEIDKIVTSVPMTQ
jgi:hypothetical protein